MKTKWYIITLLMIFCSVLWSQEIHEESFVIPLSDAGKPGTLRVNLHNGSIAIEGYSGKEVQVALKAHRPADKEKDNREGLRRISNTALDIQIREKDNRIEIDGGNSGRTDFVVKVPVSFVLEVDTHHNGNINVKGVKGEMELHAHFGSIVMEDVAGSALVDTHHGEVKARFNAVTAGKPMAFSTYHGDVDVSFPSGTNFEAKVKTSKGDIFTDFEVEMKIQKAEEKTSQSGLREIKIGGWMYGSIGSGGQEYMFTTYHGDIILRKT